MSRYKYLTNNGRIPENTICTFVSRCIHREPRCFEVKAVDFSCGAARLIESFLDEFMKWEEISNGN